MLLSENIDKKKPLLWEVAFHFNQKIKFTQLIRYSCSSEYCDTTNTD
jgi:hypothetical protein